MSEESPWARPQEDEPAPPAETVSLSKPGESSPEPPRPDSPVNLDKPFAAPDAAAAPLPASITGPGTPTGYFAPGAPPPGYPPAGYPAVGYPPAGAQPGYQPAPPPPGYGGPPVVGPAGIYGDPGFGATSAGAAAPYTLDAYGMPVPARQDPMAAASLGVGIASLVLSLMSCCCWYIEFAWALTGLTALALGAVSYRHIVRDPGRRSGRGFAIGGMVTGAIGAAIAIGILVIIGGLGLLGSSQSY